jgi:hypothetical protein
VILVRNDSIRAATAILWERFFLPIFAKLFDLRIANFPGQHSSIPRSRVCIPWLFGGGQELLLIGHHVSISDRPWHSQHWIWKVNL